MDYGYTGFLHSFILFKTRMCLLTDTVHVSWVSHFFLYCYPGGGICESEWIFAEALLILLFIYNDTAEKVAGWSLSVINRWDKDTKHSVVNKFDTVLSFNAVCTTS